MTGGLKLRDYQTECIDAVFSAWGEGLRRPAAVLPTGAGKTVVFSELVRQFRGDRHPETAQGRRVIVLVHRDELADQAISKLRSVLPADVSVGKVKAQDRQTAADVMVCSVQTISRAAALRELKYREPDVGRVGLIITDECHHAAAASYRKVYDAFPGALHLGVTATLGRSDSRKLSEVWEEVVYTRSVLWMISKKYLSDVRAVRVEADFDLSAVKTSRGDWQAGDLGAALEESHAEEAIARAYTDHAKDRPGVVFTPTVATAEKASEALNRAGVVTEVITGETPREVRRDIFDRYRQGDVQVLANCMVLTEGFDAPWASCAVIARPTQSAPLYVQMVGRVLRTWPGKSDALVLDVVGASAMNKLSTIVDLDPALVRDVQDGESLREAAEREEEAAESAGVNVVPGSVTFELSSREADLFAGSEHAWSVTPRGVMFIECGGTRVFLWPAQEGGFTVCTVEEGGPWVRTEHRGLDLGMAMAWGETVADDAKSTFGIRRNAPWRSKPVSERQAEVVRRMGLDPTGMRAGQASDLIGASVAARMFDKHVGRVYC